VTHPAGPLSYLGWIMPTRPKTHRPVMTAGGAKHIDPDQAARIAKQESERARKAAIDRTRPSARRRGYDRLWAKVRAQHLAEFPLCSEPGCGDLATVADHIISIRQRPDLRLDRTNLRSFCKPHHDRHTARTQGFAKSRSTSVPAF
jgi:5-methylcytosine-specific restriction protein A